MKLFRFIREILFLRGSIWALFSKSLYKFILNLASYRDIDQKLAEGKTLTEQDVMRLVIMPLTYKDNSRKQKAVSDAAQLAGGILDDGMKMIALAGIMAFLISNFKYRSRKMRRILCRLR